MHNFIFKIALFRNLRIITLQKLYSPNFLYDFNLNVHKFLQNLVHTLEPLLINEITSCRGNFLSFISKLLAQNILLKLYPQSSIFKLSSLKRSLKDKFRVMRNLYLSTWTTNFGTMKSIIFQPCYLVTKT